MKQNENDQNHKKESTPVVDDKPNGKSQLTTRPGSENVWAQLLCGRAGKRVRCIPRTRAADVADGLCSYRMSTPFEPNEIFNERHYQAVHDAFVFTIADPHIFNLLRAGPQRLTTVVNKVGRILPSTSKHQRIEIKRQTMVRIGELIRSGKLRRVERVFVGLMVVSAESKIRWPNSGFPG